MQPSFTVVDLLDAVQRWDGGFDAMIRFDAGLGTLDRDYGNQDNRLAQRPLWRLIFSLSQRSGLFERFIALSYG
jgi:hypothetical protein